MIEPRPYQLEALEAVANHLIQGITRQLIVLPTGTGKTVVFALIAKELKKKTLIIAHTEELINQAVSKFRVVWPDVDIGIVKAESDDQDAQVVIASIQTISRDARLQMLKAQDFDLLIIDEAHHAAAPSYEKVIRALGFLSDPHKLMVGVTATPSRGDGIGLNGIFQKIVFERSMPTMIRARYLSPLVGQQIFTKTSLAGIGFQHGDFIQSELARMVNTTDRNRLIVDSYMLYGENRKKALAFCVNVEHAKDLADVFTANGIPAASVYGALEQEERKRILSDFASGRYRILTNCQLLTEGFDDPSIDCVIMGRPTASTSLFTQMVGRGTRTFPNKRDCLILDFTDNASRHNLCNASNTLNGAVIALNGSGRENACERWDGTNQDKIVDSMAVSAIRVMKEKVEEIDFFDSTSFAWVPVGKNWHLKLSESTEVWVQYAAEGYCVFAHHTNQKTKLSNRPLPLDYALGIAEDWARKQKGNGFAFKNAEWRSEPASQKQIEYS